MFGLIGLKTGSAFDYRCVCGSQSPLLPSVFTEHLDFTYNDVSALQISPDSSNAILGPST